MPLPVQNLVQNLYLVRDENPLALDGDADAILNGPDSETVGGILAGMSSALQAEIADDVARRWGGPIPEPESLSPGQRYDLAWLTLQEMSEEHGEYREEGEPEARDTTSERTPRGWWSRQLSLFEADAEEERKRGLGPEARSHDDDETPAPARSEAGPPAKTQRVSRGEFSRRLAEALENIDLSDPRNRPKVP